MVVRALIVDDSSTARKILRRTLPANLSFELVDVSSGAEAVTYCRAQQPDLVLLDLTMPEMDGYAVLEQLQSMTPFPKVIVISGDVQLKARERVLALGAAAFIRKPVSAESISNTLREVGVV